jgi:hypothetical protein
MNMIITLTQMCDRYNVDRETLRDFADFGLYPIVSINGELGIDIRHLDRIERVISLYQTLGVNKEGIDIILELRDEIAELQRQVENLKRKEKELEYRLGYQHPRQNTVQ